MKAPRPLQSPIAQMPGTLVASSSSTLMYPRAVDVGNGEHHDFELHVKLCSFWFGHCVFSFMKLVPAAFADEVNVAAFFLTNSCKLSGPWPVSVSTSFDIRS